MGQLDEDLVCGNQRFVPYAKEIPEGGFAVGVDVDGVLADYVLWRLGKLVIRKRGWESYYISSAGLRQGIWISLPWMLWPSHGSLVFGLFLCFHRPLLSRSVRLGFGYRASKV